jgi:hypothetical protein
MESGTETRAVKAEIGTQTRIIRTKMEKSRQWWPGKTKAVVIRDVTVAWAVVACDGLITKI